MMNFNLRTHSLVAMAIIALLVVQPADAQLFNKIKKGVETVKKRAEKVDKAVQSAQKSTSERTSTACSSTGTSTTTPTDNETPHDENEVAIAGQKNEDENLKEGLELRAYPHLTQDTKFIIVPSAGNLPLVTNVSEGIFGVPQNTDYMNPIYEFWTINGKKLFSDEWEKLNYQEPRPEFHNGVVAMRKVGSTMMKRQPIYLLFSDGHTKQIPGSDKWFGVTNFKDGLALVADGLTNKYFYINTAGEKVFPQLTLNTMPEGGIRPLRDGMRAFALSYNKWGYIDDKGNIKLPAKYKEAGDFSDGYAWVVMDDDTKHLIDKTGQTIFKLDERRIKTSEVVDGIFYTSDPYGSGLDYFDVSGKKLLHVAEGNQFFGGYAYVYMPKTDFDLETPTYVIDKNMNIVTEIPHEIMEWAELSYHKPKFNSNGYAPVYSSLIEQGSSIIRPNGEIVIRRCSNVDYGTGCNGFGDVSEDGYFLSTIRYNTPSNQTLGGVTGVAIMDLNGKIHWVISDEPTMRGPLTGNSIHFPTEDFESGNKEFYLQPAENK